MLKSISIENIAIIKSVEMNFFDGFNVLTGETGAGKSILIDAINAVLGERTNKELIRSGCDRANVTAVFESVKGIEEKLESFGVHIDDDRLFLQRTLNSSGKNTCRINGTLVPLSVLKEIGECLIDIHGQHDNRNLLNPEKHIDYLDKYADNSDYISDYYKSYTQLKALRRELNAVYSKIEETKKLTDLYEFQAKEIEAAKIRLGEKEELITKRNQVKNAKLISEKLIDSIEKISGDMGAVTGLESTSKNISELKNFLKFSEDYEGKFLSYSYELAAISFELKTLLDKNEFSEGELEALNDRISFIDGICRKYGGTEESCIDYYSKITAELETLSMSEESVKELEIKIDELENDVIYKADKITDSRKKAAADFCQEISNTLKFLQMPNVKFDVEFNKGKYKANGCDEVEFLISANPGQPLKPISKIASGGELSRIMLAIKSVFSGIDDIDTVIFDEIDTGISGTAADKVGIKLDEISFNRQIICVTHLAQIAAKADSHFLIKKNIANESTETTVKHINGEERIKEIARIISGGEMTESLRNTAKELLGI